MKSEEEIRAMMANDEARLKGLFRGDMSDIVTWIEETVLNVRIQLMKEILETGKTTNYESREYVF